MDTIGILHTVKLKAYRPPNTHDPDLLDYYFRGGWREFSQYAYDQFEKHIERIVRNKNGKNIG